MKRLTKKTGAECPICKVDGAFLMAKIATLEDKVKEEKEKKQTLYTQQLEVINRKNQFIKKLKLTALGRIKSLVENSEALATELEIERLKNMLRDTPIGGTPNLEVSKALDAHYKLMENFKNFTNKQEK